MTQLKPIALLYLLAYAIPSAAHAQSVSPIQISIHTQPLTIEQGGEVRLRVTLTNVSDRPIDIALSKPECDNAVYVRDAAGGRLARVDGRAFTDVHGRTVRLQCAEMLSRKVTTIKPGEQTEDFMTLSNIFDLSKPGIYTVTVARDIDIDHAAPMPTLVVSTSNAVRLTVVNTAAVK